MYVHTLAFKSIVQSMAGETSIAKRNSNRLRSVVKAALGFLIISPHSGSCRLDDWSGPRIAPETGLESYALGYLPKIVGKCWRVDMGD